jgi:RNA polymerase sigma-70 factor (ECF subfamily)
MHPSLKEESDGVLLKRAADGSEEAFVMLYRRHQGRVFRFALRMSGDEEAAEEVVQEVFLTVIRGSVRYDTARGSLAAWLLGVARNHVLRILEREPRATRDVETAELDVPDASPDVLASLLARERSEALRRAVLSLPSSYREVLALCDLEELDYTDAARALGCSLGTIRSRLHRARSLLAAKLIAAGHRCSLGTDGCAV